MPRDPEAMDQFSAHMDRAWDLVSAGDTLGARSSARHAQEIDPDNPEVHNLLGYISAADGDADDALEHYRQAMALDDEYLEPMLNAAEVLVHPLGEFDEAISLCDEALEISLSAEEQVDALMLKFDALLGKGDREGAGRLLADVPEGPYEAANYEFLIGRAHYDVGQTEPAAGHLGKALAADPEHADAHYYLGILADDRGDIAGAVEHYSLVRELDRRAPRPAWSLALGEFRKAVDEALGKLSAELTAHVEGAKVFCAEAPGMELVADGCDPRIPVLLDGLEQKGAARLFVYQRNVERTVHGVAMLKQELPILIAREIEAVFIKADSPDAPEGP
jgi:tetratricopeptide (TPR) repeat protein